MNALDMRSKWCYLGYPLVLFACMIGRPVQAADESAPAEPIKDIREVLSREAFEQSGLNKLTQQELIHLSGSLFGWSESRKGPPDVESAVIEQQEEKRASRVVQTVAEEASFGSETMPKRPEDAESSEQPRIMRSRIEGEFRGWDGRTFFELENGQIWKQIDDNVFVRRMVNPEVEIRRGLFGAYYLNVKGFGSRCKVQRVR